MFCNRCDMRASSHQPSTVRRLQQPLMSDAELSFCFPVLLWLSIAVIAVRLLLSSWYQLPDSRPPLPSARPATRLCRVAASSGIMTWRQVTGISKQSGQFVSVCLWYWFYLICVIIERLPSYLLEQLCSPGGLQWLSSQPCPHVCYFRQKHLTMTRSLAQGTRI